MRDAIIYARISSKDQEREGYSIPAQIKLLREYAQKNDLRFVRGFAKTDSAKCAGRKKFEEMLAFFRFLYLRQTPAEKAKLLKMVLSNCSVDATSIYPTYRKPFDLIFTRAKNEEWRARRDSNPRPCAPEAHALSI